MPSIKLLGTLAVVAGGIFAVACSGGDASSECGADCPVTKPARKPTSGDPIGTPVGGEQGTEPAPTTPTPTPDAGADAAKAAGPRCTALATCCTELKSAGYSTATCDGAVAKRDEPACTTAHSSYVAFGDCTSPYGPDCTQLNACCAQIKTSGAPSDVCEAAVVKSDQAACKSAYVGYKAYGPCT